jgi:hypothetical protein
VVFVSNGMATKAELHFDKGSPSQLSGSPKKNYIYKQRCLFAGANSFTVNKNWFIIFNGKVKRLQYV